VWLKFHHNALRPDPSDPWTSSQEEEKEGEDIRKVFSGQRIGLGSAMVVEAQGSCSQQVDLDQTLKFLGSSKG
jgi:hypothetical protein